MREAGTILPGRMFSPKGCCLLFLRSCERGSKETLGVIGFLPSLSEVGAGEYDPPLQLDRHRLPSRRLSRQQQVLSEHCKTLSWSPFQMPLKHRCTRCCSVSEAIAGSRPSC